MDDLIEALKIFSKYLEKDSYDYKYPTNCTVHDLLLITAIKEKDTISKEDQTRLFELSFEWNDEYDAYGSYKFGSS